MRTKTEMKRIEERSVEAYIVMATMTTCGAIICHCGSASIELVAETTGVVLGGVIGMAIFGVILACTGIAQVIRR